MPEENLENELGIRAGALIDSPKAVYVIDQMLGEGGFGAVYLVHDEKNKVLQYALKVEKKLDKRRHSKLKMEIAILKAVKEFKGISDKDNERFMRHYTDIVDRGKKEKYFFLVMELVGKSLADIKAILPLKIFSMGTGLGVAHQCLEAVEGLHGAGYIHRDLKPANYACGPGSKSHTVYILDFGIARMFKKITESGSLEVKAPRQSVGFKGTIRFASLACHKNTEMGPKDDCESWVYLLLDLVQMQGLPWRRLSDRNEVKKVKEDCRKERRGELFADLECREEFSSILEYIDNLTYSDRIDYTYIYETLKLAGNICKVNLDDPYDWE